MASRVWSENAKHVWVALLAAVLMAVTAPRAQAQVNNCQAAQYLDRTAPGADRQLLWDFSITTDPERCLKVQVGQAVVWNGDLGIHPLAGGGGGDTPNPISLHQNGTVTFNNAGTFGFVCLSHSSMRGAIQVVAAQAAPALSPWLVALLTVLVLASGLVLLRNQRGRRAVDHS